MDTDKLPPFAIKSHGELADMSMSYLQSLLLAHHPNTWEMFMEERHRVGEWLGLRDYVAEIIEDSGEFVPEELDRQFVENTI